MTLLTLVAQLREKAAKADLPDHDNCCEVGECPACDAQDDIEALLANPAYLTAILDAFDEMREALVQLHIDASCAVVDKDGRKNAELVAEICNITGPLLARLDAEIGGGE